MTAADRPSPDDGLPEDFVRFLYPPAADGGAPVPQTERGTMTEGLPDPSAAGLDAPASPVGTSPGEGLRVCPSRPAPMRSTLPSPRVAEAIERVRQRIASRRAVGRLTRNLTPAQRETVKMMLATAAAPPARDAGAHDATSEEVGHDRR